MWLVNTTLNWVQTNNARLIWRHLNSGVPGLNPDQLLFLLCRHYPIKTDIKWPNKFQHKRNNTQKKKKKNHIEKKNCFSGTHTVNTVFFPHKTTVNNHFNIFTVMCRPAHRIYNQSNKIQSKQLTHYSAQCGFLPMKSTNEQERFTVLICSLLGPPGGCGALNPASSDWYLMLISSLPKCDK